MTVQPKIIVEDYQKELQKFLDSPDAVYTETDVLLDIIYDERPDLYNPLKEAILQKDLETVRTILMKIIADTKNTQSVQNSEVSQTTVTRQITIQVGDNTITITTVIPQKQGIAGAV